MFVTRSLLPVSLLCIGLFFAACNHGPDHGAWNYAQAQNNLEALDSFMITYPASGYISDAQARKEQLTWQLAEHKRREFGLKKYLAQYPSGEYQAEAQALLDTLTPNPIDLKIMGSTRFVGLIDYGAKQLKVISMRFTKLQHQDDTTRFSATINTEKVRKDLSGYIDKNNYIYFEEAPNSNPVLGIAKGRVYMHDALIIESVNPDQYWSLRP